VVCLCSCPVQIGPVLTLELWLTVFRGPLLFSLLLSFLLSRGAKDGQGEAVFSGVFAMVWVGSAVVTFQIKLLGGSV
jgi:hypothetical protein